MSITLEQIDLLRERANASYQDAKEALEKSNNNLVEALVYLEKENKIKASPKTCDRRFIERAKYIVKKGNETKFIIKKDNNNIINLPVTAAIIIGVVATPVAIIGIPVALLTNHRIKIEKENGEEAQVNKIFDTVSDKVNSMADMLSKECRKQNDDKNGSNL